MKYQYCQSFNYDLNWKNPNAEEEDEQQQQAHGVG